MVRVNRIASSISSGVGRAAGSSASAFNRGLNRFSPDAASFKRFGESLTKRTRRGAGKAGDAAGDAARRGVDNVGDAAGTAARRGADNVGDVALRGSDTAGDMLKAAGKSKTYRKRLAEYCTKNPVKCTAGMALTAYTAKNMVGNSLAQQECITKCLPPNWTSVVESNGEIVPEYFLHDPRPEQDGKKEKKKQPQCTKGRSCEPYCIAACEAEYPTTIIGAALEGTGEILDDIIVPFAEDVLKLPISDFGGGIMLGIRIAMVMVGLMVIFKVKRMIGFGRRKREKNIRVSINTSASAPASAPAPASQLSDPQVQLANRAMDIAEKNPELARVGMQMMQKKQNGVGR